jgi:hypothetical protein
MSADDAVGTKRRFADISNQQLETIVQDKDAKNILHRKCFLNIYLVRAWWFLTNFSNKVPHPQF